MTTKKILRATARTFFFLLAKFAELLHSFSLFFLDILGDAADDPDTPGKVKEMTVREIAEKYKISKRKAHEIYKKSREVIPPLPQKKEASFRVRRLD